MEVISCKHCKRLFNQISKEQLCPSCVKEMDKRFADVKKYIYDHPGATVSEVAEECEVSVGQIKRWVREERLYFSNEAGSEITCENCGVSICSGRYCSDCKSKLMKNLQSVYQADIVKAQKKEGGNKMRFLNN